MPKDLYDIIVQQPRFKIMLTVASSGSMTVDELCKALSDFPEEAIRESVGVLTEAGALVADAALSLNNDVLRRHTLPKALSDYVS